MDKQRLAERVYRFMKREKVDEGEATRRIFNSLHYHNRYLFGEVCRMVRRMRADQQLPLF